MAVSYHYCLHGKEFGPVGFRELVRLVRDDIVGAEDLVKADWQEAWQPAATVVGLFHMAGRDDVLAKWEAEQKQLLYAESDDAQGETDSKPSWQERLIEMHEREIQQATEPSQERTEQRLSKAISQTTAIAKQKAMARQEANTGSPVKKTVQRLTSVFPLVRFFRWGLAFVTANLCGYLILNWALTEMQRFPQSGAARSIPTLFPFWGECSPTVFIVLLADTMLLAGVAGYLLARGLELLTDE